MPVVIILCKSYFIKTYKLRERSLLQSGLEPFWSIAKIDQEARVSLPPFKGIPFIHTNSLQ